MDSDQLDGISAVRDFVERLVTGDGRCQGMKVLLLDGNTTQIISCVSSQSEILSREVYLVSRIDDPRGAGGNNATGHSLALNEESTHVGHMKAVCFLRPTEMNIGLLVKELASPRFSEYHLYFSGILPPSLLNLLAENDAQERVRQVQEFYADFLPINPDLLSLNCRNTLPMTASAGTPKARDYAPVYQRNLAGLQSMLLALKRQPAAIRMSKKFQDGTAASCRHWRKHWIGSNISFPKRVREAKWGGEYAPLDIGSDGRSGDAALESVDVSGHGP